jgi:hypothetical protein
VIICVDEGLRVRLDEPDDFRRFSVRIESPGLKVEEVRQALREIAVLEDAETAWVEERALRNWPELEEDRAWQSGLDEMIAKAKPYGWIDEEKQRIKAHVERSEAE